MYTSVLKTCAVAEGLTPKQRDKVANPEDDFTIGREAWMKGLRKKVKQWKLNDRVDSVIRDAGRLPLAIMAATNSTQVT